MDTAAELGRNPVSKRQIQPEYGDGEADAGRDCRSRLARPNSQARTRTGKCEIVTFPVQLTTSRIDNLTRLIHIIADGSVEFCEATPIGLVDEPKVSLYGHETDQDLRSACRCVA